MYGIFSSGDSLASTQQTVAQYGEDRAFEGVSRLMNAHNGIWRDMAGQFVDITTDRQRRYGGGSSLVMDEVDEFGRGDSQKLTAGDTVGFPLRLFHVTLGWTRKSLQNLTMQELNAQVTAAQTAHLQRLQREVKRAIYKPTNATFVDRLTDSVSLSVKALANADSANIPPGPNGESFNGATHTHYLYTAGVSLAAADLNALATTTAEHYNTGRVMLVINSAQEAAVRALTGFTPVIPLFVTPATTAPTIQQNSDLSNLNNRLIGYWGSNYAPIWVKPWAIAGYVVAWVEGQSKPLALRERRPGAADLIIAANDEQYPLRAETMEAEFGVGVWNRVNAAALAIDAVAAGAYTAPTIN